MTKLQTSEFRHATNLLRGVCSLGILIWHYQHFFFIGTLNSQSSAGSNQPFRNLLKPFYQEGDFAVQIFWCISGLILAHTYMNQPKTGFVKFSLARFSRLYPLHILTLLVVAVIQFISMKKFSTYQIYALNDLHHFVTNLFFIQAWGKLGDGFSFNAPSWSVSVEIVVYVIFFLLLGTLRRGKIIVPLILLFVMRMLGDTYPPINDRYLFFQCLTYFLAGVCVYFAVAMPKPATRIALLTILVVIAPYLNPAFHIGYALKAFIVVCCAAFLDTMQISGYLQPVRVIGELTYSVFLWHVPLQMIILMIMMQFNISNSIAQSPLFLLFFLALTYSVGYASYRWIEQPARKYINNRFVSAQ